MNKISGSLKEILVRLHEQGLAFETSPQTPTQTALTDWQNQLQNAAGTDPRLSSLRNLIQRLKLHSSDPLWQQKLRDLLIPLERLLDRAISDEQFIVSTTDQPTSKDTVGTATDLIFVLDNLRSAFNVGSIFRLADCVGRCEIWLCGYTPTPENLSAVVRTSMGAAATVRWRSFHRLDLALQILKSEFSDDVRPTVIALETAAHAKILGKDPLPKGPLLILVGNERFGLDVATLKQVDSVFQIPTFGSKNSLNVSNALSIVAYHYRLQAR